MRMKVPRKLLNHKYQCWNSVDWALLCLTLIDVRQRKAQGKAAGDNRDISFMNTYTKEYGFSKTMIVVGYTVIYSLHIALMLYFIFIIIGYTIYMMKKGPATAMPFNNAVAVAYPSPDQAQPPPGEEAPVDPPPPYNPQP